MIARPGKTPNGAEVVSVIRHVASAIRRRWPKVEIVVRGDSHDARHEAMAWCDAQFDTILLALIKVALPSAFPYQSTLALLIERTAKLPP